MDYNTLSGGEGADQSLPPGSKSGLFFNIHTHVFNFKHVHNRFLKGMTPWWVRLILIFVLLIFLLMHLAIFPAILSILIAIPLFLFLYLPILILVLVMPSVNLLLKWRFLRFLTFWLQKLIPGEQDMLERLAYFIRHSYDTVGGRVKTQEEIFNKLLSYYPRNTKVIALAMDMDYIVNCRKPYRKSRYTEQLKELIYLKGVSAYKHSIYPFIHTDPRRVTDKNLNFYNYLRKHFDVGDFQGIKIYPALGYFPFDRRLKPIYDLALKYSLPIIAHCARGPVYYRGSKRSLRREGFFGTERYMHPFTGNKMEGRRSRAFAPHFSHPLNYYCLMNMPAQLNAYWRQVEEESELFEPDNRSDAERIKELEGYRNLKICLAHYGGTEEWLRYLLDPWTPDRQSSLQIDESLYHPPNGEWFFRDDPEDPLKKSRPYSWYATISELLTAEKNGEPLFPNLYTDISSTMTDERILPLLKVRLDTNKMLASKILFGTDFYMLARKASERQFSYGLRAAVGESHFEQIALTNPLKFLTSDKLSREQLTRLQYP